MGEDPSRDVTGSDPDLSWDISLAAGLSEASVPSLTHTPAVQLPRTAHRYDFHSQALASSSDGSSVVKVNRFGDILDARHHGAGPCGDVWVLQFAEIGKIMAQSRWNWSVALAAMGNMSIAEHFELSHIPPTKPRILSRAVLIRHDYSGGALFSFGAFPPLTEASPTAAGASAESFPPLLLDVDCPDPEYPTLLKKAQSWYFSGTEDDRVRAIVDTAGRQVSWYVKGNISQVYTKKQLADILTSCLLRARRAAYSWLAEHFSTLWKNHPTWLTIRPPIDRDWGHDVDQVPESLIENGWVLGTSHTFEDLPEFLAQPADRWQPYSSQLFDVPKDTFGELAHSLHETKTSHDNRLSVTVDAFGRVVSWSVDPDMLRWNTLGEIEWILSCLYLSACKELQLRLTVIARQSKSDSGIRSLSMGLVDFSLYAPEFAFIRQGTVSPMRENYVTTPYSEDTWAEKYHLRVKIPHKNTVKANPHHENFYLDASRVAVTCFDAPGGLLAVSVGADCLPTDVRIDPEWSMRYSAQDVPWLLDQLYLKAADQVLEAQIRILLPVWRTPEHLVVDRDLSRLWFATDLPTPFHQAPVTLVGE